MQQTHFENVVDAGPQLGQIYRFADEVLGSRLQSPQLVGRLGSNDQDGQVTVRFDFLEPLHHLESVHDGHLEIQQNQIVGSFEVHFADSRRVGGRVEGSIAGDAQHTLD